MMQIFIDNEWVNSASGKSFSTVNPATGETFNIEDFCNHQILSQARPSAQCRRVTRCTKLLLLIN